MLKICLFLVLLAFSTITKAQQTIELNETKPTNFEGLELGYTIRNEQNKDDYSRYEVSVFITNKTGCHKFYLTDDRFQNIFSRDYTEPGVMAVFDCSNATGKRLTSKSASAKAKPFFVSVPIPETRDGKTTTTTRKVQGGFALRNGESVGNDFIVIVPLGERPKFKCRIVNASEF